MCQSSVFLLARKHNFTELQIKGQIQINYIAEQLKVDYEYTYTDKHICRHQLLYTCEDTVFTFILIPWRLTLTLQLTREKHPYIQNILYYYNTEPNVF